MSDTRQEAHAYLDHLPNEQLTAIHDLLESMLSPEEAAAIQAGIASLDRNGGVPIEEVLADLGISTNELKLR